MSILSLSLQAVETNLASKDSHWVFVNEVRGPRNREGCRSGIGLGKGGYAGHVGACMQTVWMCTGVKMCKCDYGVSEHVRMSTCEFVCV